MTAFSFRLFAGFSCDSRNALTSAWSRGRWTVENKVHRVRDVTYDEDRSQIRTGTGPRVMAARRDAVIRALRAAGTTNIAAANRRRARDSTRPLALLGLISDFAEALGAYLGDKASLSEKYGAG